MAGPGRRGIGPGPGPTNRWLLVALVAAWATGTLAFATGAGWTRPVALAHAAAGLLLVVLVPGKTPIVRRGLRRRSASRTWPSVLLGVLVVAAVATGVAHSAGLRVRVAGLDALWLHVALAIAAGPLVGWHLVTRPIPWRRLLRRPSPPTGSPRVGRRAVVRGGTLLAAAAALTAAWEGVIRVSDWRGATRRGTGSYPRGSHDPARMPTTMWLDDTTPSDTRADGWTVELGDADGTRLVPVAALAAAAEHVTATVDCTGGWYAEQRWRGVRLDRLLRPGPAHTAVRVRSVTGYARRLPVRDLPHLWLASGYAAADGTDVPLRPGHGAPLRLVAPGRRGFWWVKWVDAVVLDDRPWWLQPPFPLT